MNVHRTVTAYSARNSSAIENWIQNMQLQPLLNLIYFEYTDNCINKPTAFIRMLACTQRQC